MTETANLIPVLAAIIRRNEELLLCKRARNKRYGERWEFPGGKLLAGESLEHAARRELREELGVEVVSVGSLVFQRQDPGSRYLIQFVDVTISGAPQALEHEQLAWVSPTRLLDYDLAPSDHAFATAFLKGVADRRKQLSGDEEGRIG